MTKAQNDFIARRDSKADPAQDARDFLTWYHPEDIHRIAHKTYLSQSELNKGIVHPPMMLMSSYPPNFEENMAFCQHLLNESDHQILPFIIAPEIGAAHFMAGFVRKNLEESYNEIFLFNPTGYSTPKLAALRLSIIDVEDKEDYEDQEGLDNVAEMEMHVSSLPVQTSKKDQLDGVKGPALVSCGPISLMFVEHILKNPDYALKLDETFNLPEHLVQLERLEKPQYQQAVLKQRQAHYERLGTIGDPDLEDIDNVYYGMVDKFLTKDWKEEEEWEWESDQSPLLEELSTSPKAQSPSPKKSPVELPQDTAHHQETKPKPIALKQELDPKPEITEPLLAKKMPTCAYQLRAKYYQTLAKATDDPALKALYTQAHRINQRASSPGIFNLLGALLSYNNQKVSFTSKAAHLNASLDQLNDCKNRKDLVKAFSNTAESGLYKALNETTMTYVDKTTAIKMIESALEQTTQEVSAKLV